MNKESEVLDVSGDDSAGDLSQSLLVVHALQVLESVGHRVLISFIIGRLLGSLGCFIGFNLLNLRYALLESPYMSSVLNKVNRKVLKHQDMHVLFTVSEGVHQSARSKGQASVLIDYLVVVLQQL